MKSNDCDVVKEWLTASDKKQFQDEFYSPKFLTMGVIQEVIHMCVLLKRGSGHLDFLFQQIVSILAHQLCKSGDWAGYKRNKREKVRLEIQFRFKMVILTRTLSYKMDNNFECDLKRHNSKLLCFVCYCRICPFHPNPINLYFLGKYPQAQLGKQRKLKRGFYLLTYCLQNS